MQNFKQLICLINRLWFELNIFPTAQMLAHFCIWFKWTLNFIKYYITFNLPAVCQE